MINSLLYFVHLCIRGKGIDEDQPLHGTAKGAENMPLILHLGRLKMKE